MSKCWSSIEWYACVVHTRRHVDVHAGVAQSENEAIGKAGQDGDEEADPGMAMCKGNNELKVKVTYVYCPVSMCIMACLARVGEQPGSGLEESGSDKGRIPAAVKGAVVRASLCWLHGKASVTCAGFVGMRTIMFSTQW